MKQIIGEITVKRGFEWIWTFYADADHWQGGSNRILHINRAQEPHVNPDSFTWHTQFLKENDQNSTWKSLHMSHIIVYSQICYTFISWHEKTKKENKNQPVGSLFLLNSCCEQAAAGMIRVFPVHFVPLQSTSTQCNVRDSRVATENCMKCGLSYETHFLATFYTISYTNTT